MRQPKKHKQRLPSSDGTDHRDPCDVKLIGMNYAEFMKNVYPNYHREVYAGFVDGIGRPYDCRRHPDRCNVAVNNGVITRILGYY